MPKLPDFEAWAVFAKIAELGSLSRAAEDLGLSKATVSKILNRLEHQLAAPLLHRNSRRVSLTDTGQAALERAARLLADGETLTEGMTDNIAVPRGTVRMTAPNSFGILTLGGVLPDFLARYPQVSIDLRLSDHHVDLVAEGVDLAIRIGVLPDSELRARRICSIRRPLVAAPGYIERHGIPSHPSELADHQAIIFSHLATPSLWRFVHPHEPEETVRVSGRLIVDNGEIAVKAIVAGAGIGVVPEFLLSRDLQAGRLVELLPDWAASPIGLHVVSPPGAIRPARVKLLSNFLAEHFLQHPWARLDN